MRKRGATANRTSRAGAGGEKNSDYNVRRMGTTSNPSSRAGGSL